MKTTLLGLGGLLVLLILTSGCIETNVCWITMSHPALDEDSCLEIANETFSEACNQVLQDREQCLATWENTEVSFDSQEQKCYIKFPYEC